MTRNLKALGLALVAALAMSAVVASAASATAINFTSDAPSGVTKIVGEQAPGTDDVFNTTAGSVKCTSTHYTGTQTGASASEVRIKPTYSGCTAFTFAGATIDPKSCEYVFQAGTKEGAAPVKTEGKVSIDCNGTDKIDVHVTLFGTLKCTVTIGEQGPIPGTITWTNSQYEIEDPDKTKTKFDDITVDINLSGIHYEEHGGTGFGACGDSTTTIKDGTYTGTGTVTGLDNTSGARANVSVD